MIHPFTAKFPFRCNACGETHPAGALAEYDNEDRSTISATSCLEPDQSNGAGFDSFTRGRAPIAVLPRGKTAKDRCEGCFQVPASNGVCGCQ